MSKFFDLYWYYCLLSFVKVIALMMDNATNNDTLAQEIERHSMEAGVFFSAMDSQMRCMPHTVHLAAIKVCCMSSLTVEALIKVCPIAS